MYNPAYVNNQYVPGSKSLTDIKPRGSTFSSAGRYISRQEDAIQHNYKYRPDPEIARKEDEAIELERLKRFQASANYQSISNASPYAYKSYADNLEKLNHHRNKLDAYTNEIQSAKMKLHNDQQNVINLQKLNRLNNEVHRDHIRNQLDKIRSPTKDAIYSPIIPKPQIKRSLSRENNRPYISTVNYDAQLDLLDQFSAGHGLDDQLSSLAKIRRPQQVQVPKRIERADPLEDFMEQPPQDIINVQQLLQSNPPNQNRLTSPARPTDIQYSQSYNQSPPPYSMNPYYVPPGYGYGPAPMQQENIELKSYMQKQNELLERLADKINKTAPAHRAHGHDHDHRNDSKDFESRIREIEKETDLKLKLMGQQQMIENLQQNRNTHTNNYARNDMYGNNPRQTDPQNNNNNNNNNNQSYLAPNALAQNLLQYGGQSMQNPYDMYSAYMNPYMNMYGGYGMNPYDPYGQYYPELSDKKKKHKKKKKRKDKSSSEEDSDLDKSSDGSVDVTPKHKKKSNKSHDKHRDKSKDKTKGTSKDKLSKKDRKIQAVSRLKTILWTIVYPHIFSTDTSNKVLDRINAQQNRVTQSIDPLTQNFSTWLMNVAQEGFVLLFDDIKKSYDFVGSEFKKVSKSDATKRATDLKKITKTLLGALFNKTDNHPIEDQYLEHLATVCYRNVYASDYTFSNFELMRMNLSSLDRISGMSTEHSQMRITIILLVRIFAYQLVFKASEWNNKLKITDQTLINLKIVASLIYRLAISVWEDRIPIINQRPSLLDVKPIYPLSMDPLILPPEGSSDDPEIILASYTRYQLTDILDGDPEWTATMKDLLVKWTEKMFYKIEEYRQRVPLVLPKEGKNAGGPEKAA